MSSSFWWWLWAAKRRARTVTLYTRPGCPLCDEARATLEMLGSLWRFRLHEVDIMANWETYEQYHEQVPVIAVNGEAICSGRVERERLREALQAAR